MDTQGTVNYDASVALTLANQAQQALSGATDFVIDSESMFEIAGDDLKQIKSLQKQVEEKRTAITGPLNQAFKAVNELFRAPKEYLESAESTLKRAMVDWTKEQERIRAIARRKAEDEARKERERLAEIGRAQQQAARDAADAARQAQAAADAAAATGDIEAAEAARREAQEQSETAQSMQAEAEATAQVAEIITMPIAAPVPQKISGISGRTTYAAQVDDAMALIQAVAAGKAPIECIAPDLKFLGAQARAFKRTGPLYPGVSVVAERSLSARAG